MSDNPASARGPETRAADRPHIVFVIHGLSMGGAESQLTSLLEASEGYLEANRVTLLTLVPRKDSALQRRLKRLNLTIETVERAGRSFPRFFLELVQWFRSARPDIVHTVLSGTSGTWGRLAARVAGVPGVMHSELSFAPRRSSWQRRMEPLANRLTDRFLPNARAIAKRLESEGVPPDRIEVVRNGVDLERFAPGPNPELRATWGLRDGAVIAGFVGRLHAVKRPDLLLDAVLDVDESSRPDLVAVAGTGELAAQLRDRVENQEWLRSHVRLLGLVVDMPDFFRSIDYLVLCSDTEGLPNVIIEAMAAGVPCIATRVSDVPDLVTDNGFLVDPGNVHELAAAIATMQDLPADARRTMGMRGRARAEEQFGIDLAAGRFWQAHLDVLRRRHAPRVR